ncbi:hypothetical protein BDQ17DRAFT_1429299 [Cyathus striatus]|nr:hypothetical protein BDQ17DRAFT_1429299 [Cyathus striatus]
MHYEWIFKCFGPAYATWVFAFECFNGELEKVNINGQAGGEMELTLLRDWILKQHLHELGMSLPDDISQKEVSLLKRIGVDTSSAQGTFEITVAAFRDDNRIIKPKPLKCYSNLRKLSDSTIYGLLLNYAQQVWPQLDIIDNFTIRGGSTPFFAHGSTKSYPFIIKNGIRYGSIPCKLVYHFEVAVGSENPVLCSIVQRCIADDAIPSMPWDLYATDLGSYVVYANRFGAPSVVPTSSIFSPVVVIPITSNTLPDTPLWVVLSLDRTGIDLDDEWLIELQVDQD